MDIDRVRAAVIGCGSIGRRHIANLARLGEPAIIAYDSSPNARKVVADDFGIPVTESVEEIFESQPGVVIVCSPPDSHVELTSLAMARGCDVFVEKPLSHTLAGTEDLVKQAEATDAVTMVGCNMRFHPGPAAVKRLLREGVIGRVLAARIETGSFLPQWRPGTDYRQSYSASASAGGAILDCIHEIDLALWFLGRADLIGAAALPAATIGLETDGLAEILLRHDCGAISSVHLNFVQRDYRRACHLIGETGTIYWDFAQPVVRIARGDRRDEVIEFAAGWTMNDMYVGEFAYFLDCVRRRIRTESSLREGREALLIAMAAKAAARDRSH